MKWTIILFIITFPLLATAFEWEAGIREQFVTKDSYTYNSDTNTRVMKELIDRGHSSISLQPRLAWAGDDRSLVHFPAIKTSLFDLAIATTRVLQAGAAMTIKPMIYENPGLGEARAIERINPRKASLALITYAQLMAQYSQLSRKHEVGRLVVGSGLVHLIDQEGISERFEAMLKNIKSTIGPKTELSLEVVGTRDLMSLTKAIKRQEKHLHLRGLIDSISLVLDPQTHFPGGEVNVDELRKTRLIFESLLPGMTVHLARVTVPGCLSPEMDGNEYYCAGNDVNFKLQHQRFTKLKDSLIKLEMEGIRFGSVEIMEANTDYEPAQVDPRYPYYNPLMRDPAVYETPVTPVVTTSPYPTPRPLNSKNGCIIYDKKDSENQKDQLGEIHAMMLQSVLGAFPKWSFTRKPLSDYAKGDLQKCKSLFYLATNFGEQPSEDFLQEVAQLSKKVPIVWINYKFPLLAETLKSQGMNPGFDVPVIIQPDSTPTAQNQTPGFYRFFDYKGETFFKLSKWNPISNNFEASPELNRITIESPDKVEVLATARHDKTNNTTPYAVRSGNIWYVADSPFSFVHYEDRFYIFCDFLWDILGETPPKERVALVRIEDVNPTLKLNDLKKVWDYFALQKVPYSIALIPFYSDLFGNNTQTDQPVFSPINKFKSFTGNLKYAINRGADIVMHGTIHSVGCLISGYDGASGDDYEFWLYPQNTPLPFDSVDWVTKRLELGIETLQKLDIKPVAFEAPHYAASVLDYMIFGKMFQWQYHRSIFMPHNIIQDTGLPKELRAFACDPKVCGAERRAILNNLKVEADHTSFSGINSPFITYRDIYGQSIIPETLGMVDYAFYPSYTWRPASKPEDILRRAKKLKVIRGAVASFFWHPLLLNPDNTYYQQVPGSYNAIGGMKSLSLIIDGLKDLGYVFKSTADKNLFPDEVI